MKFSVLVLGLWAASLPAFAADFLPPGRRPLPPGTHALVGARVVVKPGTAIDNGTILVRDGLITGVGAGVAVPADARVWDLKGTTIYAGFIEPYLATGESNTPVTVSSEVPINESLTSGAAAPFLGVVGDATDRGERGPGSDVPVITPQRRVFDDLSPASRDMSSLRELGFTTANVVPGRGILRGTGALINLREANPNEITLRPDVFQHVAFEVGRGREGEFPAALMGVIAAVRQTFFDARHNAFAHAHYQSNPAGSKRPEFNPALEALRPVVYEKQPVCIEPGSVLMVDRAARLAKELGLEIIITASGQEWRRPDLLPATGARFIVPLNLPSIPRLPREDDWADIDLDRLRAWDWAAENPAVLRRAGREIALTTYSLSSRSGFRQNLRTAIDRGLTEDDALAALTTAPASFCGVADRLGTIEAGKIANLTVVEGSYFDPDKKVREVWVDGRVQRVEIPSVQLATAKAASKTKAEAATKKDAPPKKDSTDKKSTDTTKKDATTSTNRAEQARAVMRERVARAPLDGRGPLATPHAVLIRNSTVWTSGKDGRLDKADVLVRDGKIEAVGRGLNAPGDLGSKTLIIEAEGKHVTPGLIDCHSHTAILGGVNEFSLPSSAMVRVGDVVNSETPTLYEQLAGGLTTANLLHGSANPIGGQNAVIKLRDGAGPEELKLEGAPPGIKFALGENVKQANSERNRTRFPQSRMGVETFFENRFEAARQYLAAWSAHRAKGGLAPRRDLELETLGEILEGKRLVHCHSYRQDEILAFLRVCERFGVKIATLQHILEGYKVADEIAKHGAGASAFSDWWAYKFEVIDAIPYAGSLMRDRGVLVSFNSDSSDLARRMNLEAAKAVKYGGTPEEEALKFVTINPAKQLRIDQRVGSLEAGKDADFVIWSGSPLDSGAVCLETWIDGKKYFDRAQSAARAAELAKERDALVAKAKKVAAGSSSTPARGSGASSAQSAFFARALEQMHSITECGECALRRELQ